MFITDETWDWNLGLGHEDELSDNDRPRSHGTLGQTFGFICGADHSTTVALRVAAESGCERDIKKARGLFLQLKPEPGRPH